MANGRINFGKQSGGTLGLVFPDGVTNTEVTLPESGTLATTAVATETTTGLIELATTAEAQAGTDNSRAITPLRLRNALNATGTAPIYACRAWVNFNGTGTVAIRASGNVSSITDNGAGDYTVNFTTAMPDSSYGLAGSCRTVITDGRVVGLHNSVAPSTSSVRIQIDKSQGGLLDSDYVLVSLIR